MTTIVAIITAVFIILIGLLIRQANTLTQTKFALDNREKHIEGLRSEIDVLKKEHKETVSGINDVHKKELIRLADSANFKELLELALKQ